MVEKIENNFKRISLQTKLYGIHNLFINSDSPVKNFNLTILEEFPYHRIFEEDLARIAQVQIGNNQLS